jgi:transposase-like protein
MLPLKKTVKRKNTVNLGGSIFMPQKTKVSAEEKLRIVEACLSGKMGVNEAGRHAGVSISSVQAWISKYQAEGPSAFLPAERNRVYSPELKRIAVEDYLAGKGSMWAICKKYKIRSTKQLQCWIQVYNRHEDFKNRNGGSRMTKPRKTTQEERVKIAKECLETGKDYGAIAQKYNASYQQVYTWTKKYSELGEAGLEDRRGQRTVQQQPRTKEEELQAEIARLKHEKYMLQMECDLLKKVKELERRDRWGK